MKKIIALLLLAQIVSFAQPKKSDWSIYTPSYTYEAGAYSSKGNSAFTNLEFIVLDEKKFVFGAPDKGPLTFYVAGKAYPTNRTIFNAFPKESSASVISGGMTNDITALCIDKNGTIWFGSSKGLLNLPKEAYGALPESLENLHTEAKGVLYKDETPGMPFKVINSIATDNKGNIWVAGLKKKDVVSFQSEGISRFDGKEWKQFIPTEKTDKTIAKLITDYNGLLYGAIGSEVFKFDGTSWTFLGTPQAEINVLKTDSKGLLYAGTSNGVFHFENGKWVNDNIRSLYGGVNDIAFDDNSIWIGSNSDGAFQILSNGGQNVLNQKNSPIPADHVWKITVDQNNKKWFFTDSGWAGFKEPALPADKVEIVNRFNAGYNYEFIEDALFINGRWNLVTSDAGLVTYDGKSLNKISTKSETNHTSVAADKNGKIYMGTSKYLYVLDHDKLDKWELKEEEAIAKQINDVLVDDKNQIWLAHNKGVSKFDGSTWQHFDKKTGLTSNQALILFQDSKNNIWLVTNEGMSKYDGTTWENFTKKTTGFTVGNLKGVGETNGKILFSNGFSLVEYDGTTMKEDATFKRIDGGINHMAIDKSGNLWFATAEKGVVKFSNGSLTYYTNLDGLPSNNVNRIFIHDNEVWASSGYKKPHEFAPMPPAGSTTTPPPPPKPSEKEMVETKVKDFEPQFALVKMK